MSSLERRLVFLGMALLFLAFMVWAAGGGGFPTSIAQAASDIPHASSLTYYGADFNGMTVATGIDANNPQRPNGPWPQYYNNYCFIAVVQALSNYQYWKDGYALEFPNQVNEGPLDGHPGESTSGANGSAWQILYDMQNYMIPSGGPLPSPSFTYANIANDFGGDPRAQAYAAWYEAPDQHYYHQYVYHNGVGGATYGLARGVATYFWDGYSPEIAIVYHALHSVVIAGVWASANPATVGNATIDSFAVYNPWDQNWGQYLNGAYYSRVSYTDWVTNVWWWGQTYNANGTNDPDPIIGMYQAGSGTSHPNSHFWIGNYVSIQRDNDSIDSADYAINENGVVMQGP